MDVAPDSAKHILESLRGQAERSIRETRLSIWNLRSQALDNSGLAAALRGTGERLTSETTIQFRMQVTGEQRGDANVDQQLLRIGQEAVTNVVRHSGASTVSLHLDYDEHAIRLRVIDDGHGFAEAKPEGRGLGVISMRERAQQIGGQLTLVSSPAGGTEVDVVVPRAETRELPE
jgi:signal transduction histidine kinase